MTDINSIAKDLNIETRKQGEVLVRVEANTIETLGNAQGAHTEMESAQKHQKGAGRCIYITVGVVASVVLTVMTIVIVTLVKK